MRTSKFTKAIVSILVGAAIVPVAPAAAQNAGPAQDPAAAATDRTHGDQIVLRREGDRATPSTRSSAHRSFAATDRWRSRS
jgi:hypothetical protein